MNTTPAYPSLIDEAIQEIHTRFQACNVGNMWHIHDRVTGKTAGFCADYEFALIRASELEKAHE